MSRVQQRQQSFCAVEINTAEARRPIDSNTSRKREIRKLHSEVAYEKLQAEISNNQRSLEAAADKVESLAAQIAMEMSPLLDSDIDRVKDSLQAVIAEKKNLEAEIADKEKSMETSPPDQIANGEELKATIADLKTSLASVKWQQIELDAEIFFKKKERDKLTSPQQRGIEIASIILRKKQDASTKELRAAVAHMNDLQAKIAYMTRKLRDETAKKERPSLPTFGPLYALYESSIWTGKQTAWVHVLRRTKNSKESETIEIYLQAMIKIEKEARQTYEEGAVDHLGGSEFQWMMIKDGCFLLQLALFHLGGSQQLGYPSDDLFFGEMSNIRHVKKWINSMFFVGKQIPLIVLEELMKQEFFQAVVKSKPNWELPSDLPGQVLYQFLLLPAQASRNLTLCAALSMAFQGRGQTNFSSHKPSDVLHGLHLLVVGQGRDYGPEYQREDGDLDSTNYRYEVSSVTELKKAGINVFVEKKGIRGITFKDYMFEAILFLPKLVVDEDTELLFQNLKDYEITQKLGSSKREMSSYLQFMSELIRTPEDAELLIPGGIIKASPSQRENLPAILSRLASKDTSHSLRLIRLKVSNYSRPTWVKFRDFVAVIVMILTLIQTVYAVVSYHTKKH